jgi:hypothetical protein
MKKNSVLLFGPLFVALLSFTACHKSSSSPINPGGPSSPSSPSSPTLVGNWSIYRYIATDFDTTGGKPHLPNDTITPTHSEFANFTKDSVYSVTWESFGYSFTTNPYSFINTQNTEFSDTSAYTATATYYVEPRFAPDDTTFIVSLTDTSLQLKTHIYQGLGPSSGVLFDILTYLHKQ